MTLKRTLDVDGGDKPRLFGDHAQVSAADAGVEPPAEEG
jgi:hypothetical protein